jgi:hypothetical protein
MPLFFNFTAENRPSPLLVILIPWVMPRADFFDGYSSIAGREITIEQGEEEGMKLMAQL